MLLYTGTLKHNYQNKIMGGKGCDLFLNSAYDQLKENIKNIHVGV